MLKNMNFARWTFLIAGAYGVILMTPMYFMENQVDPPAITHPELYYGFVGVTLAFQFAFLIISKDPVRFRPLMVPSVFEKISYVVALVVLFAQHRVGSFLLLFAGIDFTFAVLFLISYLRTPKPAAA